DDLQLAVDRAKERLEKKGRALPDFPAPETDAHPPAPESSAPSNADLDAAAIDVASHLHRLEQSLRPFLLRGEGIALIVVCAVILGGAAAGLKQWPPAPNDILLGTLIGLGFSVVLLLFVRTIALRRIGPAIAAFSSTHANASGLIRQAENAA